MSSPAPNTLSQAFKGYAKRLLELQPEIARTWTEDETHYSCTLAIPAPNKDGFGITMQVSSDEIVVSCDGFHEHLALDRDADDLANSAVGLLYDLLSPQMRLREFLAGKSAYK